MKVSLAVIISLLWIQSACTDDVGGGANPSTSSSDQSKVAEEVIVRDESSGDTDPEGNSDANNGSSESGKPGEQASQAPAVDPVKYFDDVLLVAFSDAGCDGCHDAPPAFPSNTPGPYAIYERDSVNQAINEGTPESNRFLDTTRNIIDHKEGGDQCNGSLTNSPCAEIVTYAKIIANGGGEAAAPAPTPAPAPGQNANIYGELTAGDWNGNMTGFAVNPADDTETVTVEFYDAPQDQGGTMLGSIAADRNSSDNFTPGFHGFSFKIPNASINSGVNNTVHAYAIVNNVKYEIGGSPFTDEFYAPQAQNVYENDVLPMLGCGGCHAARSYIGALSTLVDPKPADGGSATNNILYNKCNGINHGGGNQCGGGLSAALQNWWNAEFQ